jgi:small subunit ribosomal protein S3
VGQKVHPFGFRLGVTENHKSQWYTKFNNYSDILRLDDKLRSEIIAILKELNDKQNEEIADRSNIFINHNPISNNIIVEIKSINPIILIEKLKTNKNLLNLSTKLKAELKDKEIILRLTKLADPNLHSSILAQSLAKQLEKRTTFRRAIRTTIESFKDAVIKADLDQTQVGIKLQVSGRLNGAEIARSEWVREGRVPLHTLQAKISYSYETAQTIYGTLGVKVWICTG